MSVAGEQLKIAFFARPIKTNLKVELFNCFNDS